MGFVSGLIGTAGGAAGTGFSAPTGTDITTPTTAQNATDAYTQNQTALQQQQNFLQAVQAQNGLGNQANVYNQLQGVVNGQGPNPAQAMLAQSTGANVANQAALMAGQRGANANVGLIARQAAQQGANTQQQAAGQAATMQAQQSLGALNQLGGIAGQQVGQQAAATGAVTGAQQTEQQALLNAIAAQNNAKVGLQTNINSANAGLASQQMGAQQGLLGGALSGAGSALGLAEGGKIPKMAKGGTYEDPNTPDNPFNQQNQTQTVSPNVTVTAPIAPQAPKAPTVPAPAKPASVIGKGFANMGGTQGAQSSSFQAGQSIGSGIGAGVDVIKSMFSSNNQDSAATTGDSDDASTTAYNDQVKGAQLGDTAASSVPITDSGEQLSADGGLATILKLAPLLMEAKGGKVPALVSPGERYLPPSEVKKVAKGEKHPMKAGEKIPGTPKVKGAKNSYANDTVHKTLQEGGIVLPRSVTQAKDAPEKAAAFVRAILAKQGLK